MNKSSKMDRSPTDAIPQITEWAKKHTSVRAVIITSTRAIPGAVVDILSDYDVILVVRDIQPWVKDRSWLDDFGEVLVAYWDPIHPDPILGVVVCSNVVQYSGGLKLDFTLWPVRLLQQIVQSPTLPKELDAGYRILVDKDHLTKGMQAPTGKAYIPKPPTVEEYQAVVNDFLSDAPYAARCIWRDELMPAKWCLDYDMKHVYLRPVLEWYIETQYDWSISVGSLGKGLKKHLPLEICTALADTYAGAETAENWTALERTMDLFRWIAREVGKSLGYVYPEELHARVAGFVNQIRQL